MDGRNTEWETRYEEISSNAKIQHRWGEIIVLNKKTSELTLDDPSGWKRFKTRIPCMVTCLPVEKYCQVCIDNRSFEINIGLWLRCDSCHEFQCGWCDETVDKKGIQGKYYRHAKVNFIQKKTLISENNSNQSNWIE